jgi:hypothetical protein
MFVLDKNETTLSIKFHRGGCICNFEQRFSNRCSFDKKISHLFS